MKFLIQSWYVKKSWSIGLLPLSGLFFIVIQLRYWAYRIGLLSQKFFPVPVIVVGNLSVGGTGKTPLVIYLAKHLKQQGFKPAIISRGYKGSNKACIEVTPLTTASEVGDEALLLAKHSQCPVYICRRRTQAVKTLLKKTDSNIVISDDGLQHYALGRDIEIAVIDGLRRHGNQKLLPAGPLREPMSRLKSVDFIVNNGGKEEGEIPMQLALAHVTALLSQKQLPLAHFYGVKVHAVAGIGNPERFFNLLRAMKLVVIPHPFPDHYAYQAKDLNFADELPILMTEKDAVKCQTFATANMFSVNVEAYLPPTFILAIMNSLARAGFSPTSSHLPEESHDPNN